MGLGRSPSQILKEVNGEPIAYDCPYKLPLDNVPFLSDRDAPSYSLRAKESELHWSYMGGDSPLVFRDLSSSLEDPNDGSLPPHLFMLKQLEEVKEVERGRKPQCDDKPTLAPLEDLVASKDKRTSERAFSVSPTETRDVMLPKIPRLRRDWDQPKKADHDMPARSSCSPPQVIPSSPMPLSPSRAANLAPPISKLSMKQTKILDSDRVLPSPVPPGDIDVPLLTFTPPRTPLSDGSPASVSFPARKSDYYPTQDQQQQQLAIALQPDLVTRQLYETNLRLRAQVVQLMRDNDRLAYESKKVARQNTILLTQNTLLSKDHDRMKEAVGAFTRKSDGTLKTALRSPDEDLVRAKQQKMKRKSDEDCAGRKRRKTVSPPEVVKTNKAPAPTNVKLPKLELADVAKMYHESDGRMSCRCCSEFSVSRTQTTLDELVFHCLFKHPAAFSGAARLSIFQVYELRRVIEEKLVK